MVSSDIYITDLSVEADGSWVNETETNGQTIMEL